MEMTLKIRLRNKEFVKPTLSFSHFFMSQNID